MTKDEQDEIVIRLRAGGYFAVAESQRAATLIEQQATEVTAVKSENHLLHSQNEKLVGQIEKLTEINKRACEDWADDDTRVKEAAKPFFTDFEINGDSHGVPGVIDIAELMAKRIKEQANEIEELKSSEPYKAATKLLTDEREITYALKDQNERLVKALQKMVASRGRPLRGEWLNLEGFQFAAESFEEAKALLAEIKPRSSTNATPATS